MRVLYTPCVFFARRTPNTYTSVVQKNSPYANGTAYTHTIYWIQLTPYKHTVSTRFVVCLPLQMPEIFHEFNTALPPVNSHTHTMSPQLISMTLGTCVLVYKPQHWTGNCMLGVFWALSVAAIARSIRFRCRCMSSSSKQETLLRVNKEDTNRSWWLVLCRRTKYKWPACLSVCYGCSR